MTSFTLELIIGAFIFCGVVYILSRSEKNDEKKMKHEIFIKEGEEWVPSVTFLNLTNAQSLCARLKQKGAITKIVSKEL